MFFNCDKVQTSYRIKYKKQLYIQRMQKALLKPLIIFIAFFVGFVLHAQEPWSLEKCISYALENNIQIKQQKINTLYRENSFIQSKAGLYPNLSAGGSYGVSFGRALDQTTYEFTNNQRVQSINANISSSVVLFSGLQKWNLISQNRLDLMASLQDLEKFKNDVSLNVAASYLQILFSEELLNVAAEQMSITAQQADRTKLLVDAGSLAHGNFLEMQSQLAADEVTVINAENSLTLSYLTLSQLLELDSAGSLKIIIPIIESIPEKEILTSVQDIYEDALKNMPEIKGAFYKLQSAETGLKIAKGTRSPRLSLSGQYGTGFSDIRQQITGTRTQTVPIGTTAGGEVVTTTTQIPEYSSYPLGNQFSDNASLSLFANVSIPIFSNLQIKYNIDNANLLVKSSNLEVENRQKVLYKEIQQSYTDALASYKRFYASEKAVTSMEESFKYTKEKYEVGLVNAVDFNIAQNQLTASRSELLKAKYDYIFKVNILNFYRGKEIKLEF